MRGRGADLRPFADSLETKEMLRTGRNQSVVFSPAGNFGRTIVAAAIQALINPLVD
jgi:hypothetical protein